MIKVSCAIIEMKDLVLVCQRSDKMDLPGKWEFPGGKLREGESAQDAIVREIKEELSITIEVLEKLPSHQHKYLDKAIELIPFRARITSGEILLTEHEDYQWLEAIELPLLEWADADIPILIDYLSLIKYR
jgi:8-oxo-dGTP diphosphatase